MKNIKKSLIILIIPLVFIVIFLNTFCLNKADDSQKNRIDTTQRVVSLTFDDGPSIYDLDILNILEEKNVHATFFEVGMNIEQYHFTDQNFIAKHPYLTQTMDKDSSGDATIVMNKILQTGNMIGNHSFTHTKYNNDLQKLTDEIIENNLLIQEVYKENGISIDTSQIPLRMPYLQYFPGIEKAIKKANVKNVIEGYLGTDYEQGNTGKEEILRQYETHLKKGIIYCCHSTNYAKEWLGTLIDWLKERNYNNFVVLYDSNNIKYSYSNYGKLVN